MSIRRGIIRTFIDLLRWSTRVISLVTLIFIALWICWFTYHFLVFLRDYCDITIFSAPWGG